MSGHNSRNDRDQHSNRHRTNSSKSNYAAAGSKSRSSNSTEHHSRSLTSGRNVTKPEDPGRSKGGDFNSSHSRSYSNSSLAFTEARISKLAKVLAMLESKKEFLSTCNQIEELILLEENQAYVQKSFSRLADDFAQVFYVLPSVSWKVAGTDRFTIFLNNILQAMGRNYAKLLQWLVDLLHDKSFQKPEVYTVFQAVTLGMFPRMVKKHLACLTECAISFMEHTQSATAFKISSSLCTSSLLSNSETKMSSFMDFIDVLFGWMLSDTDESILPFCIDILHVMAEYFKRDMVFTTSMLTQLFDDFYDVGCNLKKENLPETGRLLRLARTTSAMLTLGCTYDRGFLSLAFASFVSTVLEVLNSSHTPKKISFDLISVVNDCLSHEKIEGPELRTFLKTQLEYFNSTTDWTDISKTTLASFVNCLSNWLETTSDKIKSGDVEAETLLQDSTKFIDLARQHLEPDGQACLLKAVHSLLRTRNISCLQISYNWLVSKLQMENNELTDLETILFVLAGLSDIAGIKTGSILSQWALDPSIFDLLISVLNWPVCRENSTIEACALQLLRAHCEAHSHFVSSIASSKTFVAEPAGNRNTRIIPTLMQFWLELITRSDRRYDQWLFEWILGFLKASAPFATTLVKSDQEFYKTLFDNLLLKSELHFQLVNLLKWLNEDQHYSTSELMLRICIDTASKLSLMKDVRGPVRSEARSLLCSFGLAGDRIVANLALSNGEISLNHLNTLDDQIHFSCMTTFEFNSFLYNLLSFDKLEADIEYSEAYIKATAEFLFQSKLKSSFGKPQEFFGHLGTLFRRYKVGKVGPPKWKLDFTYQLEKNIVNAIHGSTFMPCNTTETVRSFYVTNKTPCMEWMKRMRPDLAEVSLSAQEYSYAFLNAAVSGEELAAKFSLLELGDSEGLKALSELGASYYLQNDLTNAEKHLTSVMEKASPFQACISKRIEAALKEATASLESWPEANGMKSLDSYISQHLLDTVKQNGQLLHRRDESGDAPKCLELLQMHSNSESLGRTLAVQDLTTFVETVTADPTLRSLHYINLADLFYKEAYYESSAKLYGLVTNFMEADSSRLDPSFAAKVYISCGSKLQSSPIFFNELVKQCGHLSSWKHKNEVLEDCYEKAATISPFDFNTWFEYGNFAYSEGVNLRSEPAMSHAMKVTAQQCYSRCVALQDREVCQNDKLKWKSMQTKTRLLSLHKAGYKFNAEEALVQTDWLQLLPSLARSKDLRPHLVNRFPDQASFLAAAYSKDRCFARVIGRRGVFDPHAFSFTEASDDAFNSTCHCEQEGWRKRNPVWNSTGVSAGTLNHQQQAYLGQQHKDLINPNVYAIIEELERIGTSREEMWSWAIEKVISDASKKLSALRKDMARESDVLKVKAYTLPLFTYLSELWSITKVTNTASENAFLNKYGSRVKELLKALKSCTTADEFSSVLDRIIAFGSMFDTSTVSRLDLRCVSPILSNLEFNMSAAVYVPGFPEGVTLAAVHPAITCLHTKAKPKRLSFRGSNGRLYEYLVKGNENLNIDSGVMQLLKISQELITLQTRTYSITPFGERGGLIQIVNDAQPVYIMYKRHLQRINCTERPAAMFFRLLNDLGFFDRSNFDALKAVYETLVKDTDREIISRELFLCSENASNWLSSTRTFTQDAAVGASIGHLAGIGDRHLDNILLNPSNGNLVHVDFSLLFGRGATLQVPEIVPFRMTQNFVSCLQYPGINGPFRVYMENIFDLLKRYNDSFMFGVEEIALATQVEEHPIVDLGSILLSELNSAVALLRFRSRNIKNALQALKGEVLEMVDRKNTGFSWSVRGENINSTEKLKKKLNRWRRLLANVDPLIQFIGKYAQSDAITMQSFQDAVATVWLPNVIHFWCHSSVEKLFESTHLFSDQLNLADETLILLLSTLPPPDANLHCNELMLTKEEIEVDSSKIRPQILGTKEKFESCNEQTVESLIASATSADNLCQMFEGWTAWV